MIRCKSLSLTNKNQNKSKNHNHKNKIKNKNKNRNNNNTTTSTSSSSRRKNKNKITKNENENSNNNINSKNRNENENKRKNSKFLERCPSNTGNLTLCFFKKAMIHTHTYIYIFESLRGAAVVWLLALCYRQYNDACFSRSHVAASGYEPQMVAGGCSCDWLQVAAGLA